MCCSQNSQTYTFLIFQLEEFSKKFPLSKLLLNFSSVNSSTTISHECTKTFYPNYPVFNLPFLQRKIQQLFIAKFDERGVKKEQRSTSWMMAPQFACFVLPLNSINDCIHTTRRREIDKLSPISTIAIVPHQVQNIYAPLKFVFCF